MKRVQKLLWIYLPVTLASAYDNVTSILLYSTLGRLGFVGCDHYEFSSFNRTV